MIEAARIDGASEFRILAGIVIPMAAPILATLCLLVGLAYWNDWQNGLYYLTDNKLFSIQVLLQNIQRSLDALKQSAQAGGSVNVSTQICLKFRAHGNHGHGRAADHDRLSVFAAVLCKGIAIGAVKAEAVYRAFRKTGGGAFRRGAVRFRFLPKIKEAL